MTDVRIEITQKLLEPAEYAHFEGEFNLLPVEAGPDLFNFPRPVVWRVDISNTGDALLVMGSVDAQVITSCARCIEDFTFDVQGEIEGYFLLDHNKVAPEEMDDDEFDVLSEDKVIDLEPLIVAALLMEFPLVPLCDEECKGLCSQCGADLNKEECDCSPDEEMEEAFEKAKNPFSALKDFKVDNN